MSLSAGECEFLMNTFPFPFCWNAMLGNIVPVHRTVVSLSYPIQS